MSTTLNSQQAFAWKLDGNALVTKKFYQVAVPVGRLFFSLIFILSGLNHFSSQMIAYAASKNVPAPEILVPLSGLMCLLGGLSILLGYKTRIGALLLVLFLIPVTLMMHDYWNISDPMLRQVQIGNYLKNISLLGAAILVFFFGAGPITIESWLTKRKKH
jgi:putative oxidoreductase